MSDLVVCIWTHLNDSDIWSEIVYYHDNNIVTQIPWMQDGINSGIGKMSSPLPPRQLGPDGRGGSRISLASGAVWLGVQGLAP